MLAMEERNQREKVHILLASRKGAVGSTINFSQFSKFEGLTPVTSGSGE
jgi:hypothetical protein